MKYFPIFLLTFIVWTMSYFFVSYKISSIAKKSHKLEKSIKIELDKNRDLNTKCQKLISDERICKIAKEKYGMLPAGSKEFKDINVSVAYSYHKNDKKFFAFLDKFISEAHAEEINENKFK